jgi:two-component sensor histidine kinase
VYDIKADKVVDIAERYGIDKLKHAVIRGTVKDEYNNMWVATNMGVCRINLKDETHQFYTPRKNDKTSIPNYDIFDLLLDNESLYVTTGNGLAVYNYDSDDFTTYLLPDSLTQNDVVKNNGFFDIVEGKDGRYYIGSYSNGMLAFSPDKKQFKATKAMGDLGTMVYAIVPDNKGNLWASTSKGIMKYQLATKETMNYDVSDGLQGSEFSPNAFLKSKDGFVFFGGFGGFNYFKPDEIQLETRMPKVIITKMLTSEGKKYRYLTHGDTVQLSHKCKSFEIEFATLNLLRRNMVKYSYMLDNYDEDWEYCNSNHRYVDYNKMRPGTYVFKIKAANEVNQWMEEPTELTIIIQPAWYQRASFNILVILLLSFAIFVVVRQRNKIVNQKREQKRIITELETQMLQLKQKTLQLQMNPHVIFNTLNSIQQYILNNDVENAVSYLSSFSKLMRRILNNSNERYITLSDEIEAVSLYLQLESMRLGNRFSYEIDIAPEVDAKNIEIAPLIVQPFVENAIIHGLVPKKDNCFLSIRFSKLSEGKLLCVVEDNGVGRKHSEKMKQERGASHKSYGMSITRRRLETLTKISNDDFSVEVVDLYDDNDMPSGTRVDIIISFSD